MWIIWVEQRSNSLSTCQSCRSDLRDGRLSCQPWNRHQIQGIVNSPCFVYRSDVRNFICDILCQFYSWYLMSDIWFVIFYVYEVHLSSLMFEISESWDCVWSSTLSQESAFHTMINFPGQAKVSWSSSSIAAASVSPHPYKVLYPDLTFLMFTLFSKIWFSSLFLVHLSLSLSIVPKGKVPSLSIFVLTFWKLKGIVPKIARDSFDFPWCGQIL